MKYYKSSKFTKAITSTGFISITAVALIAVGAVSWFALSKNNNVTETPQNNSLPYSSYPDTNDSYNSTVDVPDTSDTPIADVDDEVSDVPYTEDVETPSAPVVEKPTFILPVTGNISKCFSDTALQYSVTYNDMRLHTGVDILCKKGTDIKSVSSGKVKSVVDDGKLGKIITIEYFDNITVKYCGMGSVNVIESDKVACGDVIGTSGEIPSECADKPHIHIEVFVDGKAVSPLEAMGLK